MRKQLSPHQDLSVDSFMKSKRRPTRLQFLALLACGASLLISSAALLIGIVERTGAPKGVPDMLALMVTAAICIAVGAFGVLWIKRAFVK